MAQIDKDVELRRWKPTDPERPPGLHAVNCERARGLYARMFDTGAITWVFRFKLHGKARQMKLGPYPAVSLAAAREAAREAYEHVKAGRDPIEVNRADGEAEKARIAGQKTFATYATEYIEDRRDTFKTPKLGNLWASTIKTYAVPHLGKILMNDIAEPHIQEMLAPIWNEKRETARRVLQRVGAIIDAAIDDGHRDRDRLNPCHPDKLQAWKKRRAATRKGSAGRRGKHPAVPVSQVPEWFGALREREGMGARAMEFVALTATRQGEVRAATWANVDLGARVWTVPVDDTKMSLDPNRQPHRVPLSDEAVRLLEGLERRAGVDLVFPSPTDKVMNDNTLSKVMRDMQAAEVSAGGKGWIDASTSRPAVPHGLRSTFRTWAGRLGTDMYEVVEAVLSHAVGGTTSLAYQRGHFFDERIPVMQAWADYLTGKQAADPQADPLTAAIETLRATGLSAEEILARLNGDNVVPLSRGAA